MARCDADEGAGPGRVAVLMEEQPWTGDPPPRGRAFACAWRQYLRLCKSVHEACPSPVLHVSLSLPCRHAAGREAGPRPGSLCFSSLCNAATPVRHHANANARQRKPTSMRTSEESINAWLSDASNDSLRIVRWAFRAQAVLATLRRRAGNAVCLR